MDRTDYILQPDYIREYKWSRCRNYSVRFALCTSYFLSVSRPLNGEVMGYPAGPMVEHIAVGDLIIRRKAITTTYLRVGYPESMYRR